VIRFTQSRRGGALRLAGVPTSSGYATIDTEAQLRELLGEPGHRAATKDRNALHVRDREWIAASPFLLLATAGADGSCDVSPKGDPSGFVHIVDDTTLAIPERPGNKRADGYLNVLANPHVGLIFLVPGRTETLRVNGRATILRDAPFFDRMIVNGHRPSVALLVHIEQLFYHCGKAFMRSQLWQPQTWAPDALPSHAAIVKSVQETAETLAELEEYYGPSYADKLYRPV
jgi:PPOX class probable FMN-dependent enzyme